MEQNMELGPATLKQCINDAERQLKAYGITAKEISTYLNPVKELVSKRELWRNPSEGLAIFVDEKSGLQWYELPIPFDKQVYVSDHYYLLPLLALYNNNGLYYVLELSKDHIKLYQGDRYSFKDLYVEEFAPEQLEEAVGFDYQQKTLQFRTGHALHSQGSFHGHGEGKDDKKLEVIKFFKEIDQGVNKVLTNKKAPLVIAGVSKWYPLYKEVNTYPKLFENHLKGDPEFRNKKELHRQSWEMVKAYFSTPLHDKIKAFKNQAHTEKCSHQISDIVPAAKNGRIDTLFVEKKSEVYGTYTEKNCLILDAQKDQNNISILNRIGLQTYLQGGSVYLLDKAQMPYPNRPVNALYRY